MESVAEDGRFRSIRLYQGFRVPHGAELVFAGAHGKQAGRSDSRHRGTELQHCRPAWRYTEKGGVRPPAAASGYCDKNAPAKAGAGRFYNQ